MLEHLTQSVQHLLTAYGIAGVFMASIIEEVVAPIPSAGVVLLAGVLLVPPDATLLEASRHVVFAVMLPASLGITLGSLFPYYVARIGEEVAVNKCGKLLGVDWSLVKKAEQYFQKHHSPELLLFFVRCVPIIPSVIIGVFSGLVHMPVLRFVIFTFLGTLVRTFMLGLLGWSVRAAYVTYAEKINRAEDVVLVLIVAAMAVGFLWWRRASAAQRKHQ